MWEKIKNGFVILGAFFVVVFLTIIVFIVGRGSSDRRGSSGTDERDNRIQEGFTGASDTARRCEERLQRAEDILREAINRSREEE